MIYWITGQTGSGKSFTAELLKIGLEASGKKVILLDGDSLRKALPGLGFSKEDRYQQSLRASGLANMFALEQGFDVIVAIICPYKELRQAITKICNPRWIYLPYSDCKPDDTCPFEEGGWSEWS